MHNGIPSNFRKKAVELGIVTVVCAGLVLAAMPPAALAATTETYLFNGTLTLSRASPACTKSGAAQVVATYAQNTLISMEARTLDDGLVLVTVSNQGAFQGTIDWCGAAGATGSLTLVPHSCSGNSLGFTFQALSSQITFGTATGRCAADGGSYFGPLTNPTPVSRATVDPNAQQTLGCAGLVEVTAQTGHFAPLPAFGGSCSQSDLCANYITKPGVSACTVNSFPPPQLVQVPGVTTVQTACLWDQVIGIDLDGDGNPEVGGPVKTLTFAPCP